MTVAIGVDVGSSAARAVAVDELGSVVASADTAYRMLTPRPGWSEQDPRTWSAAARQSLREVASAVGPRVVGIGLTGQMHGSVFLDGAGDSIRPALLWNDQRTAAQCAEIDQRIGADRLVRLTGNPASTGFQAPKILWLREHEPEHYRRLAHVLLPKDHLRLVLTGEYATDASDAAGTSLLDLRRRAWSSEIIDALGFESSWLSRVLESPEVSGTLRAAMAEELGLPEGIPVAAGAGDNAAAAVGTGIVRQGRTSSSIGTSGVLFTHLDEPAIDPDGRVHAFCHAVPGRYSLMAVTLSAGGSLQWWRDVTGVSFETLVSEAEATPPGAEGLVFVPHLTGERTPYRDPRLRGGFVGLTARHTRGHLTRAVMEGVGFSLREGFDIVREITPDIGEVRATGGGAEIALWRRLQADILGVPIRRMEVAQGAAYGAALLGHVAAGTFRDVLEATSVIRPASDVDVPDPATQSLYAELFAIYRTLVEGIREGVHRLDAMS